MIKLEASCQGNVQYTRYLYNVAHARALLLLWMLNTRKEVQRTLPADGIFKQYRVAKREKTVLKTWLWKKFFQSRYCERVRDSAQVAQSQFYWIVGSSSIVAYTFQFKVYSVSAFCLCSMFLRAKHWTNHPLRFRRASRRRKSLRWGRGLDRGDTVNTPKSTNSPFLGISFSMTYGISRRVQCLVFARIRPAGGAPSLLVMRNRCAVWPIRMVPLTV